MPTNNFPVSLKFKGFQFAICVLVCFVRFVDALVVMRWYIVLHHCVLEWQHCTAKVMVKMIYRCHNFVFLYIYVCLQTEVSLSLVCILCFWVAILHGCVEILCCLCGGFLFLFCVSEWQYFTGVCWNIWGSFFFYFVFLNGNDSQVCWNIVLLI